MRTGEGRLAELRLDGGKRAARIICPPELIPAPGQYLLAHTGASDSPLAVPIFFSESTLGGFHLAPPLPSAWIPGTRLHLRGPLGYGFTLPATARRAAFVAFDDSPARLRGLIAPALKQETTITLACAIAPDDLQEDVEILPLSALNEMLAWADYIALDVARENLPQLLEKLGAIEQAKGRFEAQVLVRTPMPCGALAECGVCAVTLRRSWQMVCKNGPVFDLSEFI